MNKEESSNLETTETESAVVDYSPINWREKIDIIDLYPNKGWFLI